MHALYIVSLTWLALLVGCSRTEPSPKPISSAARDMFKTRCAGCHGETGQGDGPLVAKLPAKPPNFADAAWQESATDDEISKVIVVGGAAVGKSPIMPAVKELEGKPELEELVAIIRSFGAR